MQDDGCTLSQGELAGIADALLERAEEDDDALARELDLVDPAVREQLLVSDFLNAFQVYYYFFRRDPGDFERERLVLQPASALAHGVLLDEEDFFRVVFRVEGGKPVLSVCDDESVLASFEGEDAHEKVTRFIDELW